MCRANFTRCTKLRTDIAENPSLDIKAPSSQPVPSTPAHTMPSRTAAHANERASAWDPLSLSSVSRSVPRAGTTIMLPRDIYQPAPLPSPRRHGGGRRHGVYLSRASEDLRSLEAELRHAGQARRARHARSRSESAVGHAIDITALFEESLWAHTNDGLPPLAPFGEPGSDLFIGDTYLGMENPWASMNGPSEPEVAPARPSRLRRYASRIASLMHFGDRLCGP